MSKALWMKVEVCTLKEWIVKNFRTLKRQGEKKKRLKCQNRGVDNSRGTFYSTIEEKLIKVNRKEKQYQNKDQPDTISPHQNSHFSLKKSSEQSSNSHISTGHYKPFLLQNLQKNYSQHLPSKSSYLLALSPTLKHHERERERTWSLWPCLVMPLIPVFYPRPSSKQTIFFLKNLLSTFLYTYAFWFSSFGCSCIRALWAGATWGSDLIVKASPSSLSGRAPAWALTC